jgi:hypothetical protein
MFENTIHHRFNAPTRIIKLMTEEEPIFLFDPIHNKYEAIPSKTYKIVHIRPNTHPGGCILGLFPHGTYFLSLIKFTKYGKPKPINDG